MKIVKEKMRKNIFSFPVSSDLFVPFLAGESTGEGEISQFPLPQGFCVEIKKGPIRGRNGQRIKKWGGAQLSNPPPIGARTRIPLGTEKINSKKRLFYALLPSKYR